VNVHDFMVETLARVQRLEHQVANFVRPGTVEEVAPGQSVRVRMSEADGDQPPLIGAAIPYAQIAGAAKVHSPPSVGQQMMVISPSGDPRQAIAIPYWWSDANATPSSNGDEEVYTRGATKVTLRGDSVEALVGDAVIKIEAGKITVEVDGAGVVIEGGKFKMSSTFEAKNKIGQPAHYVTGLDSGGDAAIDGQPTVIL
jgi:phage baseplate assembly protein gpV